MFKFVFKQKCNKFIYAHQNIEQFINVIKMIICKKIVISQSHMK